MSVRAVAALVFLALASACSSSGPVSRPAADVLIRTRTVSESFTPRTDAAALRAFVPDVAPVDSGGECSVTRTGGSGATVVSAAFPTRAASHTTSTITFDSAGHLVRFSERRGAMRLPSTAGMTDAQRDSVMRWAIGARRSSTISFDYVIDQAIATNTGGGQPTSAILGPIREVEKLEALGPPTRRLALVRKLCGV
jgi:hypothetical protein